MKVLGEGLLIGKVALITGAGRGVGRDIALMMAGHGAKIIVNDLGAEGDGADQASDVSGQIFTIRNNEIFLMGQSRPLRGLHRGNGWTPETVLSEAIPAMQPDFHALDRTADVFSRASASHGVPS